MEIRQICNMGAFLFSTILLHQVSYAVCNSNTVDRFIDGKELHAPEVTSNDNDRLEVCEYRVKYSREGGGYYMYTLLKGNNVVYCGITNHPGRRAVV